MTILRIAASRLSLAALIWLGLLAPARAADPTPEELADQAHDVFRTYCAECHGGSKKVRGELNVLNPVSLLRADRPVVKSNDPEASELFQLVECGTMPPGTRPKVPDKDRAVLHEWIKQGAPPFAPEYSDAYALTKILNDVRAAKREPGRSLADERYVTLNHLLAGDDPSLDLDVYRAALAKALNQLSTRPGIVALTPIDPTGTIFRIKLSDLGWDAHPFAADPKNPSKDLDPTAVNLYDLLLLDYPLASLPERSDAAEGVVAEYLARVKMLRPIPFVRGDWLCTVATEAPLYNDLLRLPLTFSELERRVKLGDNATAQRAAFSASAVVKGNRIVERRSGNKAALWRTYDLAGMNALQADAEKKNPAGGEVIFHLPNGLPGYFIADNRDMTLDAIPPALLREPLAKDDVRFTRGEVRNGLSCMICHDRGLISVKNEIKPPTNLYPGDDVLGKQLDEDNKGYAAALQEAVHGYAGREPLAVVSRRFRQQMTLADRPGEVVPVNLDSKPHKSPLLDASYVAKGRGSPMGVVARGGANLFRPILPLDASGVLQFEDKDAGVSFDLMTINLATKKPDTRFKDGDEMAIVVKNTGTKAMYFEVFITSEVGDLDRLPVADDGLIGEKKPNEEFRFEFKGKAKMQAPKAGELTKQRVIVYAAAEKFPPGVMLNAAKPLEPGYGVSARVVHPLYQIDGKKVVARFDATKIVRKTIEFETLVK